MLDTKNISIIKKDGTIQKFDPEKIKVAVMKSASRVLVKFSDEDLNKIIETVLNSIESNQLKEINISKNNTN